MKKEKYFAYYKVITNINLKIIYMNKKLIFGSTCLGLVLVLSACGTTNYVGGVNNNPGLNEAGVNRPDRRPDFGQPKTMPEVRGLVKSVVGTEVAILKIEQAQRGSSTPTSTETTARRTALSLGGSGAPTGRGGMGGFGGGRPDENNNSTTDRTALLAQMKAMSTGEEKVVIPVGIKMLKTSNDGTRTMVEANISDITADKMITIWLDASVTDKKVASFVLIN
jgi:hypothetical protein